jgi:hypothetical protein
VTALFSLHDRCPIALSFERPVAVRLTEQMLLAKNLPVKVSTLQELFTWPVFQLLRLFQLETPKKEF